MFDKEIFLMGMWICDICGSSHNNIITSCLHRSWYVLVSVLLAIEAGRAGTIFFIIF
jgi:hypothetical protein